MSKLFKANSRKEKTSSNYEMNFEKTYFSRHNPTESGKISMQGTCSSLIKMISHFDLNVTHLVFCYRFFTVKKHFLNRLISAFWSLLQWLQADSKLPSCTHECILIIKVFAICPLFKQRWATPNVNFRKISLRKTIWDLELSEHLL